MKSQHEVVRSGGLFVKRIPICLAGCCQIYRRNSFISSKPPLTMKVWSAHSRGKLTSASAYCVLKGIQSEESRGVLPISADSISKTLSNIVQPAEPFLIRRQALDVLLNARLLRNRCDRVPVTSQTFCLPAMFRRKGFCKTQFPCFQHAACAMISP